MPGAYPRDSRPAYAGHDAFARSLDRGTLISEAGQSPASRRRTYYAAVPTVASSPIIGVEKWRVAKGSIGSSKTERTVLLEKKPTTRRVSSPMLFTLWR